MSKTIAVCNQKGGVGKTTTVINLAGSLTKYCGSVLIVDLDPQGNATSGLGLNKDELNKSVYHALIDDTAVGEILTGTGVDWLDILPSNIDLIGAEVELLDFKDRESKLKNVLAQVKNCYDYILVDCPPSLGILTLNALTSADSVLIPLQCEYYAMEGLTQLMKTVHLVRRSLNPDLQLEGVLLTMFDGRMNLSNQVVSEVKKFFEKKVYSSVIPRNVRLAEAPSHGIPVFLYDPSSKGTQAYLDLAKEFLYHGNTEA